MTAEPWVHAGARGATTTACDRTALATSCGTGCSGAQRTVRTKRAENAARAKGRRDFCETRQWSDSETPVIFEFIQP